MQERLVSACPPAPAAYLTPASSSSHNSSTRATLRAQFCSSWHVPSAIQNMFFLQKMRHRNTAWNGWLAKALQTHVLPISPRLQEQRRTQKRWELQEPSVEWNPKCWHMPLDIVRRDYREKPISQERLPVFSDLLTS